MAAPGLESTTFQQAACVMCLVCVLFVLGSWPKSNSQNWTVVKLKGHYIIAYMTTNNGRQLMSDRLRPTNQPKPTQTITQGQLHSNITQPIFHRSASW